VHVGDEISAIWTAIGDYARIWPKRTFRLVKMSPYSNGSDAGLRRMAREGAACAQRMQLGRSIFHRDAEWGAGMHPARRDVGTRCTMRVFGGILDFIDGSRAIYRCNASAFHRQTYDAHG